MVEVRFHDLLLLTAPGRVMTPRAATEALVDRALELIGDRALVVADVGTGSGAIAVALAVRAPRAEIWATDVSSDAVALARRNAIRLGVADRVHILEGDLLDPVPGCLEVVVANLPYLPDTLATDPEYVDLRGEPAEAVFASNGGLEPYGRLLEQCETRLVRDGRLLIQFHRCVMEAGRDELDVLRERLELHAY